MSVRAVLYLIAALACITPLHAQSGPGWDPTGLQLKRAELEQMLEQFESMTKSNAYSGAIREQARSQGTLIRQRLAEGDMRVGDRVMLVVEGQTQLSDTFTVVAGRRLVLPDLGEVALEGVLRSELQPHLAAYIGRFIREPKVHARSLIRMEIMGAVGSPGFYTIPSDMLISDALMLAGGPAPNAVVNRLQIKRNEETIWDGGNLRDAVIEGRTLDQLSVRAGDAIYVPQASSRLTALRNVMVVVTGITSLLLVGKQLNIF